MDMRRKDVVSHARRQRRCRSVTIKKAFDQISKHMPAERALQERSASDIPTPDPAEVNEHLV